MNLKHLTKIHPIEVKIYENHSNYNTFRCIIQNIIKFNLKKTKVFNLYLF